MKPFTGRLQRCILSMQSERMSRLLVSSTANLYYLTGQPISTGERLSCLYFDGESKPKLFIHQMFAGQLSLPEEIETILWADEDDPVALLAEHVGTDGEIAIDLTWSSSYLIDLLRLRPQLLPVKSHIVEKLREIKDECEVNTLRQSARIADAVMHQVVELQYYPATEREMAETIRSFFGEHSVHDLSFQPIIGFGKNSANPHHEIGMTSLIPEQALLIDMGGVYHSYCSDITRTLYYGKQNQRFEEIYKIVRAAQEKAIEMIRPGVRFADVDRMIRSEFAKVGYDRFFTHRTGHGLGLELHEGPFLHQKNEEEMQAGMVFSIEPGIYLPGEFGVRIEDIVVVTEAGCEILTQSPKEISYIDIREG
ncbi:M24 family metallopeptidase [Brevibacillus centrosporus]|uniref:M24 family metallopeptidase n=1 Tax=Brevibacillus centrosporus TaxID=54910 RepID=UPI00380A5852